MRFTHLHVASSFSAHYGTTPPAQLVEHAAARGADALAITDRDGLYGAIRHIGACRAAGIDPIVGVELGCVDDTADEGGRGGGGAEEAGGASAGAGPGGGARTSSVDRIVVLAHGAGGGRPGAGWAALCRLISAAHGRATRRVSGSANSVATIPRSRLRAFLRGDEGADATVLLGPDSDVGRLVAEGRHTAAAASTTLSTREQARRGAGRPAPVPRAGPAPPRSTGSWCWRTGRAAGVPERAGPPSVD